MARRMLSAGRLRLPGEQFEAGQLIFEEQLEGVYRNNWWVEPISTPVVIKSSGQAEVTIRAEGRTAEFSGHLVMNCRNSNHYWKAASNVEEPLSSLDEANSIAPRAALENARGLICAQ